MIVVGEIIPSRSYINLSFWRIVHFVSFETSDWIFTVCLSSSLFQERPNILVSFNFLPSCCFVYAWSSVTTFFSSKVETLQCHSWNLKPAWLNIFIAISFNDATCSKLLPPEIRSSTYRSSFISATSIGYFSM